MGRKALGFCQPHGSAVFELEEPPWVRTTEGTRGMRGNREPQWTPPSLPHSRFSRTVCVSRAVSLSRWRSAVSTLLQTGVAASRDGTLQAATLVLFVLQNWPRESLGSIDPSAQNIPAHPDDTTTSDVHNFIRFSLHNGRRLSSLQFGVVEWYVVICTCSTRGRAPREGEGVRPESARPVSPYGAASARRRWVGARR